MILILHKNANKVLGVERQGQEIGFSASPSRTLWNLAQEYPEEILVWVEESCADLVELSTAEEEVSQRPVMISYAVHTKFLSEAVGYIDQMPFIRIHPDVRYPTWRMSSDIGAIGAKTLLRFGKDFCQLEDFDFLLNSIAKVGQQNGLFCYSVPGLLQPGHRAKPVSKAGNKQLLSFVYSHYKTVWTLILFFCLVRYEKRFPLLALFQSFLSIKFFGQEVAIPEKEAPRTGGGPSPVSMDVILPTLGRRKYLEQVLEDLSIQSSLPRRIVIVEQNPDPDSATELQQILNHPWPFELVHIFTHHTGACGARNQALSQVKSDWVFFADDDIRLQPNLLEQAVQEAHRIGADCLNLSCRQEGEKKVFKTIKQWGSFGAGTSIVRSRFALMHQFSEVLEHGYGEDVDYGMKLRSSGCDIILHPDLVIQHLKAPIGGFRRKPVFPWEGESPEPKPAPTLMILAKKYFSEEQLKGFKISLYLKFFREQQNRNPITYLLEMEKRWNSSRRWAKELKLRYDNRRYSRTGNEVHTHQ